MVGAVATGTVRVLSSLPLCVSYPCHQSFQDDREIERDTLSTARCVSHSTCLSY